MSGTMADKLAASWLKPHQLRVIQEHEELWAKLGALRSFLRSDQFKAVDKAEQVRLLSQESLMSAYARVLRERIANFDEGAS